MPIENIPAIREDYPLFSWDDHEESFAALKKGGEVAGFKKETWNAIIDTLHAVLTEGGLSWDSSSYTTAENAKITEAYGALSAAMFNAVRHNIDHPLPIGWKWANDRTFRGYVGRKDFKGYADYGVQGDLFYAEYLVEIVRKLNLLIEILRGSAPFAEFEHEYAIETKHKGNLLARRSAPLARAEIVQSNACAELLPRRSAPIIGKIIAKSKTAVNVAPIESKPMAFSDPSKTEHKANAEAVKSAPMNPEKQNINTDSKANLRNPKSAVIPKYKEIISSKHDVFLFSGKVAELDGKDTLIKSLILANAHSFPSVPMGAEMLSHSLESAGLNKGISAPISATERVKSSEKAMIEAVPSVGIKARETVKTAHSARIDKTASKPISAVALSASISSATLDFAWIPPIRSGKNLHIRQVYAMERNGNDLRLI